MKQNRVHPGLQPVSNAEKETTRNKENKKTTQKYNLALLVNQASQLLLNQINVKQSLWLNRPRKKEVSAKEE